MDSLLYPLCAVLAWLAAFYQLLRLRQRRDAPLITLCVAFILLAAAFTISTPVVWLHLDRLAGYPNLSALLSQGCVLLFAASLQVLLLLWLHSRDDAWSRLRPRSLILGVVLAVMLVLFLLAPTTRENSVNFAASNAGDSFYAAYLLLYVIVFAIMQIEVIRLCLRYARICPRPWLRRGLRTTTVGAMFGLVYCAARIADVGAALAGLDPLKWEVLPRLGAGGGEVLYLIGWTMPAWGPRLSARAAWVASYRAHCQLYPLWSALNQLTPDLALDPPASRIADILDVRDLDFRLHRRVVESKTAASRCGPTSAPWRLRRPRTRAAAASWPLLQTRAMRSLQPHSSGSPWTPKPEN